MPNTTKPTRNITAPTLTQRPVPKFAAVPLSAALTASKSAVVSTKRNLHKVLLAKATIAIASVAITLGGWAVLAVNETKVTAKVVSTAMPIIPAAPTSKASHANLIGPPAPKQASGQTANPKPAKLLRVVAMPTPIPPPVVIAITRSSG